MSIISKNNVEIQGQNVPKTIDIGLLIKKIKSQMYTEAILKWKNNGNAAELIEKLRLIEVI